MAKFYSIPFLLFFSIRLPLIVNVFISNDEAIYVRWAQLIKEGGNIFMPLEFGIPPFFMWCIALVMQIVPDPLVAGRMTSLMLGTLSLFGIMMVTHQLFQKKMVTFFSGIFYAIFPLAIFYERLVVIESVVATFSVWILFFLLKFVDSQKLFYGGIVGFLIGGAMLAKVSGQVFLLTIPLTLILLKGNYAKKTFKAFLFLGGSFVASFLVYSLLLFSPMAERVNWLSGGFVYSKRELITQSVEQITTNFFTNVFSYSQQLTYYVPLVFIVILLIGTFFYRVNRQVVFLFCYVLLPISIIALFAKNGALGARHTYPYVICAIPIFAYFFIKMLEKIDKKKYQVWIRVIVNFFVILLIFFQSLIIWWQLLFNIPMGLLLEKDRFSFINQCGLSDGLLKTIHFFKNKNEKVYVATKGVYGYVPQGLQIYLNNEQNITIEGFLTDLGVVPQKVLEVQGYDEKYFITAEEQGKGHRDNEMLELLLVEKDKVADCWFAVYRVK